MAARAGGASAFEDPSSFNVTARITRIVAVACAKADAGRGGGSADRMAAARSSIGDMANALAAKW